MDMPVNVPVDDPNADTEWNDILRQHGVIPEKSPSPTPIIQEAIAESLRIAHENRLEGKDLDELDALEDDEDEEFLEKYRKQRLQEIASTTKASKYNQVYPLQKPEYAHEVTEASRESFVFVLLTSSLGTNSESALLVPIWRILASKFGDVKFCQIQANLCIEGYPEKNTPTVLVYKDADIKRQIITLRELNRDKTTVEDFQKLLVDVGAVQQNDFRLISHTESNDRHSTNRNIRQGNQGLAQGEDDDSDWD